VAGTSQRTAGAMVAETVVALGSTPRQALVALGDDDKVELNKYYSKFVTTDSGLKYLDAKEGDG